MPGGSQAPGGATPVGDRAGSLVAAAVVAAAVTLAVVGRSLGTGLYLYRDFVTVPEPAGGRGVWGSDGEVPRAVPLDGVMAGLSGAVSTGVQQQVMLVGSLFLAGLGVAVLLRRHGLAAMLAGLVCAIWNPFVAERLLVGQPPTLLAYSMTPWLVVAVRSRLATPRALLAILVAALPAALTPWGGVVAAAVVLATTLATPWRRTALWFGSAAVLATAWCAPWVLAGLKFGTGAGDGDAAHAFAAASDSPLGLVGSVLTLGGIWAPGARPDSRGSALAGLASLVLVAVAVAGLVVLARRDRRTSGLAAAVWLVPVAGVVFVSTQPGIRVFDALQSVPGVALGRDSHRWLGLSAMAAATLVGVAVGALRSGAPQPAQPAEPRRLVAAAAAVVVGSVAAVAVPDLPKAVHAAYQPVQMPADWATMVRSADLVADGRGVLLLPWQPFRQTAWSGGRPFLDPLPRALSSRVVASHQLTVPRGGRAWRVDDDPPGWAALGTRLSVETLAAEGVGAVVVWKGTAGQRPAGLTSLTRIHDSENFEVWAVTRPT